MLRQYAHDALHGDGFDGNYSRHITQCFTEDGIGHGSQPLLDELARLRAHVAELEGMTP